MKSNFLKKIINNIRKRSFYLVLMACVIAITITAVYVTKARLEYLSENTLVDENSDYEISKLDEEELEEEIEEEIEEKDAFASLEDGKEETSEPKENEEILLEFKKPSNLEEDKKVENLDNKITKEEQKGNNETIKDIVNEDEKIQKKFSIENIIMPVEGKVIKEFSIEKLLYSKTLDQWCTHKGIDISSPAGTPIKAVADGIIEDIYKDDMLGITIVIDHGEGYITKYSNLSSTDMVEKQELVKAGQIINGIGKTSISEKSEESHLHFEIIHNNVNIDPYDYLPISSMN